MTTVLYRYSHQPPKSILLPLRLLLEGVPSEFRKDFPVDPDLRIAVPCAELFQGATPAIRLHQLAALLPEHVKTPPLGDDRVIRLQSAAVASAYQLVVVRERIDPDPTDLQEESSPDEKEGAGKEVPPAADTLKSSGEKTPTTKEPQKTPSQEKSKADSPLESEPSKDVKRDAATTAGEKAPVEPANPEKTTPPATESTQNPQPAAKVQDAPDKLEKAPEGASEPPPPKKASWLTSLKNWLTAPAEKPKETRESDKAAQSELSGSESKDKGENPSAVETESTPLSNSKEAPAAKELPKIEKAADPVAPLAQAEKTPSVETQKDSPPKGQTASTPDKETGPVAPIPSSSIAGSVQTASTAGAPNAKPEDKPLSDDIPSRPASPAKVLPPPTKLPPLKSEPKSPLGKAAGVAFGPTEIPEIPPPKSENIPPKKDVAAPAGSEIHAGGMKISLPPKPVRTGSMESEKATPSPSPVVPPPVEHKTTQPPSPPIPPASETVESAKPETHPPKTSVSPSETLGPNAAEPKEKGILAVVPVRENASQEKKQPVISRAQEEIPDQESVQSLFLTEDELTIDDVVERCTGLPGIRCCILARGSGVISSAQVPDGIDILSLTSHSMEMLKNMRESLGKMGVGEIPAVTLHSARGLLTLFPHEEVCLLVLHADRSFVPGVREKLIDAVKALSQSNLPLALEDSRSK